VEKIESGVEWRAVAVLVFWEGRESFIVDRKARVAADVI
jgi:hypothetical protein